MKHIYKTSVFFFIMLLAMVACKEEDNLQPEGQWELSVPEVIQPVSGEHFVLNQETPNELLAFGWTKATSSVGYGVYYSVKIVDAANPDFDNPIIKVQAENSGKDEVAHVSYVDLDTALSLAGYAAGSQVELTWAVVAESLSKEQMDSANFTVTRFENEIIPNRLFISGTATEAGADLANAISLRRLTNSEGNPSNIHEMYTSLVAGEPFMFYSEQSLPAHKYGGADGELVKNGDAITVAEDGQYRITVDLDTNTYSFLKIDRWNVRGTPIIGGWGADEQLDYLGSGVWQGTMDFVQEGGFLFRADVPDGGFWSYLLKRVAGTSNEVIMESQAANQGLSYEDIPNNTIGSVIVTLDLSSDAYTYSIERDPNAAGPIATPEALFLFVNDVMTEELAKDGDVFKTASRIALQASDIVSLNDAADGSGKSYTMLSNLGATDDPNSAKVLFNGDLMEGAETISVETDQAYELSIDFANAKFSWNYYNIFLFHWDELNQKWDDRNEFQMTYVHPFKYTLTENLSGNFDMKFISPWDNDFGAEDPAALTGNMINKGGSNFRNISNDGSYTVNIEITSDYTAGTYEFVAN